MLTKRIIPCMDIKDNMVVKGVNFQNIYSMGDPVELGRYYSDQGADELVYLDITAGQEHRNVFTQLVEEIAMHIQIPFTVGGGINSLKSAAKLLESGADKITINTAALNNPQLITQIAKEFGSQCVVLAIDAKFCDSTWEVYSGGGRLSTGKDLYSWAVQGVEYGAGEILFTSINNDGTQQGFASDALRKLSESVNVPVIASGGAGTKEHFKDVFINGNVDAALAASIFHNKTLEINSLKEYLKDENINVRIK